MPPDITQLHTTGLVYHPRFLDHINSRTHPESPRRLQVILEKLQSAHFWPNLIPIPVTPAPWEWIHAVHDPRYVRRLQALCRQGGGAIDPDTNVTPDSDEIARLAVGGVLNAVDAVFSGPGSTTVSGTPGVENAFCAVRPPGHHAEHDHAMGFCLFNNIAIAANYLIQHHHLSRVAIIDFDVHHGNGTQHIFESRNDVFFISIHQHPRTLYPGTGYSWETGTGPGQGFTLNIPLDPGAGDRECRHAFLTQILPALDQFRPQFLLISAGFDASEYDPLAQLKFTTDGFLWITRQLKMVAQRHASGRIVSILEGGYDLRSLAENVLLHVGLLMQPEGHDDLMALKSGFY